MAHNTEMNAAPGTVSGEEPVTLGHVLASAREACGLTLGGVAFTLRLEPRLVAALEADRLELFVAPVFVKGHLRHLAELYGLRYEELLALYVRDASVADVQHRPVPGVGKRRRVRWSLVIGGILLAGFSAFIYVWIGGNSNVPFQKWNWEALLPVLEPAASDALEPAPGLEMGELSGAGLAVAGMDRAGATRTGRHSGEAYDPGARADVPDVLHTSI